MRFKIKYYLIREDKNKVKEILVESFDYDAVNFLRKKFEHNSKETNGTDSYYIITSKHPNIENLPEPNDE